MSRGSSAIVVCGHAVFKGGAVCKQHDALNDNLWELLPYQTGEPAFYAEHIQRGVKEAFEDKMALLILSGGASRPSQILSEGQSYYQFAQVFDFWGMRDSVQPRTTTEEFSRDSYDNCILGIARFAECTGRLPTTLTIISWKFKKARFRFHVETTLNWQPEWYRFLGVGNPKNQAAAEKGEIQTLKIFQTDCTGYGPVLGPKKADRNPFRRHHGYVDSVPCMRDALLFHEASPLPKDICPWLDVSTNNRRES